MSVQNGGAGNNPLDLDGIEFIEFSSLTPSPIHGLFVALGFTNLKKHKTKKIDYYRQHEIHWLLNHQPGSFASKFFELHGPSISAMGWRVKNSKQAQRVAGERGARVCDRGDYADRAGNPIPAIYGVGDSLIYFIDNYEGGSCYDRMGFESLCKDGTSVTTRGFVSIDHLTNNVPQGTMQQWADFYKNVFGFTEVRYFDIKGEKTGLTSYALRSPCGKFCIPINEGKEDKSQINEYLKDYHGAGIQHVALLTNDILKSLKSLESAKVKMLDVEPEYYQEVFHRVPNVTEDKKEIQKYGVLIDGDEDGYLLQIFTKNLIGPIFFEIIQRKNYFSFGEGNFGALFRSIERDQERRGAL